MIQLTRLRRGERFYLNPDLFERVDTHVDTVIQLVDGTEYVVVESGDEIARRVAEFRAQVIAVAAMLQAGVVSNGSTDGTADEATDETRYRATYDGAGPASTGRAVNELARATASASGATGATESVRTADPQTPGAAP